MASFKHSATVPNARREAPRVLLVEPGRSAMSVLARRLGEAGYRVAAAESAQAAVAELYRRPVDLVLAELAMPLMSGIELTRLIRDDSTLRDLPVILISARSDRTGAVRALESGADDVVVKPFHNEVLLARITRQLTRARSVRELRADNAALDARVVTRALELGETRAALLKSENECVRLTGIIRGA